MRVMLVADIEGTSQSIALTSTRVWIGRGEACDLRLEHASVDPRHASVRPWEREWVLVDHGSRGGSSVGDVPLLNGIHRVIRRGDRIRVGQLALELRDEETAPPLPTNVTREIAMHVLRGALRGHHHPEVMSVRVTEGPSTSLSMGMPEEGRPYVIGRATESDLSLADADVSRAHAEVVRRGASVFIRDLGSSGGTRLGVELLTPHHEIQWPRGTMLRVGQSVLALDLPLDMVIERLASEVAVPSQQPSEPAAVSDSITPKKEDLQPPQVPGDEAPMANVAKVEASIRHPRSKPRTLAVALFLLASVILASCLVALIWLFFRAG